MQGSNFAAAEKCIHHQMALSTQYFTKDGIILIKAPVQSWQLSPTLDEQDFTVGLMFDFFTFSYKYHTGFLFFMKIEL